MTRNAVVPCIVDKCFGANRQSTKTRALELLMLYIEIDSGDYVVVSLFLKSNLSKKNAILQGLDHKTPKNVLVAVYALKEAIRYVIVALVRLISRLFGSPVINLKPILKQLPKIFDHKDAHVRQQVCHDCLHSKGSELVLEIYKWMGPAINSCLSNLKPILAS